MSLSLEEAICRMINEAEINQAKAESYNWLNDKGAEEAGRCIDKSKECTQIAEWLIELKTLKG